MRTGAPRVAGFTLVEALVSLAVLAVVGSMAYRSLDTLRAGAQGIEEHDRLLFALVALFGRMQWDLERMVRDQMRDAAGADAPSLRAALASDSARGSEAFDFVRAGGEESRGRTRRVGFRLRAGELHYELWPDVSARNAPAESHVLLSGVRSCRFRWLDASGRWRDRWPSTGEPTARALAVDLDVAGLGPVRRLFLLP